MKQLALGAGRTARILAVLAGVVLVPAAVFAQATIAGVVKDTAGTAISGVTVEAASDALIEKSRTVVTDSRGEYQIVDLRPGTYVVTFKSAGFLTVTRDGLQLSGTGTFPVNGDMARGTGEGVRVTADTPTVDTRSAAQGTTTTSQVVDNIATGRSATSVATLAPSVQVASATNFNGMGTLDVGGAAGDQGASLAAHGSLAGDQLINRLGLKTVSPYTPNPSFQQEQTVESTTANGDAYTGGVKIKVVPREGGNVYRGVFFGAFANDSMQQDNLTSDLINRGLKTPNSVKKILDINPGFGGPIIKDKLTFYVSPRLNVTNNWVGAIFNDPYSQVANVFYDPNNRLNPAIDDPFLTKDHRQSNDAVYDILDVRFALRVNTNNKLGMMYSSERICRCQSFISSTESTGIDNHWGKPHHIIALDWTSVITRRLLLQASASQSTNQTGWFPLIGEPLGTIIRFTEQSTGISSKGYTNPYKFTMAHDSRYQANLSYVTGTHNMKVGFENGFGDSSANQYLLGPNMRYTLNLGVPIRITEYATPFEDPWKLDAELGIYAQDKWTMKNWTLTGGVRFDYYRSSFTAITLGPGQFVPTRNITLPDSPNVRGWKDLSPRMGVAYNVGGKGRTAVRAGLSRFVTAQAAAFGLSPVASMINSSNRRWTDGSNGNPKDFIPQCDLVNPLANGECQAMDNVLGAAGASTTYDPNILSGWGVRQYNWELNLNVQHKLFPKLTVDAGFYRRWFGNQITTDNQALSPSDFTQFSIPAPIDPRLPNNGNYTVTGLFNLNPDKFSGVPVRNYITSSDTYGGEMSHWNGVDFNAAVPFSTGLSFRGGFSTGRTSTDKCAIQTALPELISSSTAATPLAYCHVDTPWLTRVTGVANYTIPRFDLQTSVTFANQPGPLIVANYNAPNAIAKVSLGRDLSGGVTSTTVNILNPNAASAVYGDRYNQLDFRVARNFQTGGTTRTNVSVQVFNALNASPVTTYSNAYGTFLQPQVIMLARFLRLSVQFSF